MKIDAGINGQLDQIPARARELEAQGFDGLISAELGNDPFFPLLLAAEHTERIELMTSIAVAFSRNPMIMASLGNDLQSISKGRFIMGLGSQIRPHIEKRFSMPWSKPASRMREFVLAMRAIWANWYEGEKLEFRGEFYSHTLMTPMFTPTDNQYGAPKVVVAAVGPKMSEVAGEVGDGMLVHAFTTERYLREVTHPAVQTGLSMAGKARENFEFCYPAFVVSGENEEQMEQARTGVTRQIAFYGSTPAYRGVLDIHGWGDLQTELNLLSKRGEWEEMGRRVHDDMLEEFAIVAEPQNVARSIKARFGGLVDRVLVTFPFAKPEKRQEYLEELRA